MNTVEIQPGDTISLNLEDKDNYFDGKIGVYIKTLSQEEIKKLIKQGRWGDSCGPIVINLLSMKEIHFNSYMRSSIPKEEKNWLFMKEEEIIVRKEGTEAGPLSIEQIIELELSQMATPPYARIGHHPSRNDKKCWIRDCKEDEYDGIWFNVWGSGARIPVCNEHFIEHGKLTLCDDIFIELKKTNE